VDATAAPHRQKEAIVQRGGRKPIGRPFDQRHSVPPQIKDRLETWYERVKQGASHKKTGTITGSVSDRAVMTGNSLPETAPGPEAAGRSSVKDKGQKDSTVPFPITRESSAGLPFFSNAVAQGGRAWHGHRLECWVALLLFWPDGKQPG